VKFLLPFCEGEAKPRQTNKFSIFNCTTFVIVPNCWVNKSEQQAGSICLGVAFGHVSQRWQLVKWKLDNGLNSMEDRVPSLT